MPKIEGDIKKIINEISQNVADEIMKLNVGEIIYRKACRLYTHESRLLICLYRTE